MSRPLRLQFAGAVYHVMNPGTASCLFRTIPAAHFEAFPAGEVIISTGINDPQGSRHEAFIKEDR